MMNSYEYDNLVCVYIYNNVCIYFVIVFLSSKILSAEDI